MPGSHQRFTLIALNAALALPRDVVCRLSPHLDRWLGCEDRCLSDELSQDLGVSLRHIRKARRLLERASSAARREIERTAELEARILTLVDRDYPEELRVLSLPPPVLYCRGLLPRRPAVAIVGSRRADAVGLEIAEFFAEQLAAVGLTIVSGFAVGIDTAAHRGALIAAGGTTVAVLGSGLDVPYPRANAKLVAQVTSRGALVTEFPLGTAPLARNFPIRNRIIAALAHGTLVVQATRRSGSLITAGLALELGRDVYAIPGRVVEERSVGTNTLIQDGALLVQKPRDILESLPLQISDKLTTSGCSATAQAQDETGACGKLLAALAPGQLLGAERLAELSSLTIEETLALLLQLEIDGRVRRYPGPMFFRKS